MYAVIFEVWPAPGRKDDYLALAGELRKELDTADGFLSIERFESLTEEGKILALSFWRDEASVTTWRANSEHRKAQILGRTDYFADYRLRIAQVERDYTKADRAQAPQSPPETGPAAE